MHHIFCDETTLIDLRYLVAAEVFDFDGEEDAEPEHGIGYVLEVGHTPQRLSSMYVDIDDRDNAFARLVAMHQAWIAHVHAADTACP